MPDSTPITHETMTIYISALEKQVTQTTLIVRTLEELNDKMKEINGHFTNGFKSDLKEHITQEINNLTEKLEDSFATIAIIREHISDVLQVEKDKAEISREQIDDIKDVVSTIRVDILNLKSSLKVDRTVSIAGWSTFLLMFLTMVLRLWGKL